MAKRHKNGIMLISPQISKTVFTIAIILIKAV